MEMNMDIQIDREHLTRLLGELVATNSVNPTLVPGAPGEGKIASVTARALENIGLDVAQLEGESGRPSVVGRLGGSGDGPSLMLNAHYDTVGVEGMEGPFSPEVRDGRMYGRGTYDMKGSLAACIEATRALSDSGVRLKGDLVVAAVADEEYASLGTLEVIEACPTDAAIVTEPTALRLCIAHRGFTWIEVRAYGRAAHGSNYADGIDANIRMGRVLAGLETLERELRGRDGHPILGPPSLHAALLEGGTGLSTYAAESLLKIERRTVPPESQEDVEAEIEGILSVLRDEDSDFRADQITIFHRQPFETSPDAPIAAATATAATPVLGETPEVVGEAPWMDSALLSAAGIDTVVLGPTGAGAHAAVEWVDLDSCCQLAEILAHAAIEYCGVAD
jgi:acetylornithine deacetylase